MHEAWLNMQKRETPCNGSPPQLGTSVQNSRMASELADPGLTGLPPADAVGIIGGRSRDHLPDEGVPRAWVLPPQLLPDAGGDCSS